MYCTLQTLEAKAYVYASIEDEGTNDGLFASFWGAGGGRELKPKLLGLWSADFEAMPGDVAVEG